MRVMAIDYGDQRIGLAVSDPTGLLCGEAWTMQEWNMERASQRIAEEAARREVSTLVLGLPKNMDGSEGARAEKSRAFAALLEADSGLEVVLSRRALGRAAQQHRGARDPARRGQKGKAPPKNGGCGRGKPDPAGLSGPAENAPAPFKMKIFPKGRSLHAPQAVLRFWMF